MILKPYLRNMTNLIFTTQGTESSVELDQQGVSPGFKDFTLCLRFIYIFQYTLIKIQGI